MHGHKKSGQPDSVQTKAHGRSASKSRRVGIELPAGTAPLPFKWGLKMDILMVYAHKLHELWIFAVCFEVLFPIPTTESSSPNHHPPAIRLPSNMAPKDLSPAVGTLFVINADGGEILHQFMVNIPSFTLW